MCRCQAVQVFSSLKAAGSVGSGLTHETARDLWTALEAGEPVVVDFEFRGWTPAAKLRHAVFKGWLALIYPLDALQPTHWRLGEPPVAAIRA